MKCQRFLKCMLNGLQLVMVTAALFTGCTHDAVELTEDERYDYSSDSSNVLNRKYKSTSAKSWGCHDPRIFYDEGTYYVYSTGWDQGVYVRSSTDLIHWSLYSKSAFYAKTSVSSAYGYMYWDDDFLSWVGYAKNNGTTYNTDSYKTLTTPNSWAPCVIKMNDKYYMFHGIITNSLTYNSGVHPAACITLAIADDPRGPFVPASTYDSSTYSQSSLVRYVWTNSSSVENSSIGYSGCYNSGKANWSYGFGCIDPEFVIDVVTGEPKEFTIGNTTCYAMTYGSWKGGIALIYVDAATLKPVCTVAGTSTYNNVAYGVGDVMDAPVDSIDGNQGTLIAGGLGAAYEGAQLIYNSNTGYYYIFVSMGDLTYEYRVGVGRCDTIDGTYYDASGVSMNFGSNSTSASSYHAIGSKIIGASDLDYENGDDNHYGWRCPGGQSIWTDDEGRMLFACHTRTNFKATVAFALQVHQMYFNSDGWPVLNQNEYYDEDASVADNLTLSDVAGTYHVILTERSSSKSDFIPYGATSAAGTYSTTDANETFAKKIIISSDGTISGCYSGTFVIDDESTGKVTITLTNGDTTLGTFKGYVLNAKDWSVRDGAEDVITFTTLDSEGTDGTSGYTGEYFWGNKLSTTEAASDVYSDTTQLFTTSCTLSSSATDPIYLHMVAEFGTFNVTCSDDSSYTLTGTKWWSSDNESSTAYELDEGNQYIYTFTVEDDGSDCVVELYDSSSTPLYFSTTSQETAWGELGTVSNEGTQTTGVLEAGETYTVTVSRDDTAITVTYEKIN